MVAECLHQRHRHHRCIIMVVSAALTVIVQFGNNRLKTGVGNGRILCKHYIRLLICLLFYQTVLVCECEGAVLFGGSIISDNTSFASFADDHRSTLSPHMNLYTVAAAVASNDGGDSTHIIRNNLGDTFYDDDQSWTSCSPDKCTSRSSGTAAIALGLNINSDGKKLLVNRYNSNLCYCRCLQNLPAFREDMHVCVDDIHECSLVTFVSGNIQQKIPYVFLPLRGQIVYPNAEISFNGLKSAPTCIVSRVRYLSRSGWNDIKNYSIHGSENAIMPFKIFHDEHRTFLQWLGTAELRANMEGRLLLIDLICKEKYSQLIFTPCISFRVAGMPNMKHILTDDTYDENSNTNKSAGFSSNEYIALALATLLLALIYVASVFLYLHFKKNKLKEKSSRRGNTFRKYLNIEDNASHLFGENQSKKLIVEEEGLIKNNPLLMKRYYPNSVIDNSGMPSGDGNRLGEENTFCSLTSNNEKSNYGAENLDSGVGNKSQNKVVSAIIHPRATNVLTPGINRFENTQQQRWQVFSNRPTHSFNQHFMQKEQSGDLFLRKNLSERQQQSDTNNIEEKHPDENISIVECPEDVIQTNSRHKLYFNPAYFEPELLMAPPPAAVEFLTKIREVMTVAKRKMSMKKFLPSLTEIPEEHQSIDESKCSFQNENSLNLPSSKNEKSFESQATKQNPFTQPDNANYRLNDDKEKRQIIQKWLQSIPPISEDACNHVVTNKNTENTQEKSLSRPSTVNINNPFNDELNRIFEKSNQEKSLIYENTFISSNSLETPPVPPKKESVDQNKPCVPLRKKQANLIKNYPTNCEHDIKSKLDDRDRLKISRALDDYESGDHISSNANLASNNNFSSSLPLDEELTMHNAIYNVVTGSTTLSKLKARYETNDSTVSKNDVDSFPIRQNVDGKYSLVSEVYVNDGYNSSETSLTSLNSSGDAENDVKKRSLSRKDTESSRLMIQLNDCPFFYSVENADDFEPDTLDRKPNRENEGNMPANQMNFVDSLERPAISLRTYGSFRQDSSQNFATNNSNLKRTFGSLQEIYQARRKPEIETNRFPCNFGDDDAPRSLTPQVESELWCKDKSAPRHRYRQRKLSPPPPLPQGGVSLPYIPPKLAKPPLPPRKSDILVFPDLRKPNISTAYKAHSCSILDSSNFPSNNFINENKLNVCFNNNVWSYRPEDSGYLSSSDSEKSKAFSQKNPHHCNLNHVSSSKRNNEDYEDDDDDDDDDDSLSCCNDGNSESGAESIETNFKFYKNRNKSIRENGEIRENMEHAPPI